MFKNAEEYRHPSLYDDEFGDDTKKYEFFKGFAQSKKKILDLACGTGLVSLYLANHGIRHITGVDILPDMISHAKQKDTKHLVDFVVSDAIQYTAPDSFDFIFLTGNAFQAFHTNAEQIALLRNVSRLSEPGGIFIFEMRNPDNFDLSNRPTEYWHSFTDAQGNVYEVTGSQEYYEETEILKWTTYRTSSKQSLHAEIECKFTQVKPVEAMLTQVGFDVVDRFEDWDCKDFDSEQSENIIFVCRKSE